MEKDIVIQLTWAQATALGWLISSLFHHEGTFMLDKPSDWEANGRLQLWSTLGVLGRALGMPDEELN